MYIYIKNMFPTGCFVDHIKVNRAQILFLTYILEASKPNLKI